jgi:broad specificity phosphatase PhoE
MRAMKSWNAVSARRIVFVRHAKPQIDENIPSVQWKLSPEGAEAAARLAERLSEFQFSQIASSPEPKAVETAQAIAAHLGLSMAIDDGFAEHSRKNVGFKTRAEIEAGIAALFANPARLVFGDETADACYERFEAALDRQLAKGTGDVIAATHGTILTIYLSRTFGIDAMPFWRGLGLPAAIVLFDGQMRIIQGGESV